MASSKGGNSGAISTRSVGWEVVKDMVTLQSRYKGPMLQMGGSERRERRRLIETRCQRFEVRCGRRRVMCRQVSDTKSLQHAAMVKLTAKRAIKQGSQP